MASDFFWVLGVGLGFFLYPWPWPRIFFVSLALASSLVSSTPPLRIGILQDYNIYRLLYLPSILAVRDCKGTFKLSIAAIGFVAIANARYVEPRSKLTNKLFAVLAASDFSLDISSRLFSTDEYLCVSDTIADSLHSHLVGQSGRIPEAPMTGLPSLVAISSKIFCKGQKDDYGIVRKRNNVESAIWPPTQVKGAMYEWQLVRRY